MPFKVRKRDDWTEQSLYEYAVGALGRRMRTVAELKRLMRQRVEKSELGDALIELVVRRLKDHGYLNDTDYAATYTSLRRDNEKFGRMRVITELKTRGVHGDIIEKTVGAAYEGINEEKQAREFLHRKRLRKPTNQKEAARIFRTLARAGFRTRTAIAILKNWDVDDEVLTALETEENA
jgi:regulatory protein